jgi:hypothetical protein
MGYVMTIKSFGEELRLYLALLLAEYMEAMAAHIFYLVLLVWVIVIVMTL